MSGDSASLPSSPEGADRVPLPLPEHLQGSTFASCMVAAAPQIRAARSRVLEGARALAAAHPRLKLDADAIEELLAVNLATPLFVMLAPTMVLELNVARLQGVLTGDSPEERFASFLQRLRTQEVSAALFQEYTVLAQQIALRLDHWAARSLEFLTHLCEDWDALRAQGLLPEEPGALVEIKAAAGDTHRDGRSVAILTFAAGARLVYKPRSLAVDSHFQALLGWLNAAGAEPAFRPIGVLEREDRGWVEFVTAAPCESADQVTRFYLRQGGYLALLYALGATDFHYENLIAAGEHPLLIDLEALFHPRLYHEAAATAEDIAGDALARSVLMVGLLPRRTWASKDNEGIDVSGLGNLAGQLSPRGVPHWERVDTDEMHMVRKRIVMQGADNCPILNGEPVNAFDYAEAIAEGFARTYRLLLAQREGLLAQIQRFATAEVRVIVRATRVYGTLLHESYHPDVLRDPKERLALFERLRDAGYQPEKLAPLVPSELDDLVNGDIPLFVTQPASRDLWTSRKQRVPDYLAEPSLAAVERRVRGLSEQDLSRQLWIARASIATMASDVAGPRAAISRAGDSTRRSATREELLAGARAVADQLESLALGGEGSGGGKTWIGLVVSGESSWRLSPLGPDLYDGLPGVILFLAQLGRISGEARYTALARAALVTLRKQIEYYREYTAIGAFTGWGGIAYAFTHLALLWDDSELLAEAEGLLDRIAAHVGDDGQLDIIGGVAGCVLALRSLSAAAPACADRVRAIARACGEHLLARAEPAEHGRAWVCGNHKGPALTGFAHGAAGIACALLEIAALTGEERFRDAARDAFAYERGLFSAEAGNWPDLRPYAGAGFSMAWCHGAPGIGLARLHALPHLPDPRTREELEIALATTREHAFGTNHTLCHGDLGNAELLHLAAGVLGEPQLREHAQRVGAAVLDSARDTGFICGNPLGVPSPGLMTGLAGVGYMFLRLAEPERVPSVLMLDPPALPA